MSPSNLLTVALFSDKHQSFPQGGLRHLIFNAEANGLAASGALVRIGRRVLIDEAKFFDWATKTSNGQAT